MTRTFKLALAATLTALGLISASVPAQADPPWGQYEGDNQGWDHQGGDRRDHRRWDHGGPRDDDDRFRGRWGGPQAYGDAPPPGDYAPPAYYNAPPAYYNAPPPPPAYYAPPQPLYQAPPVLSFGLNLPLGDRH